MHVPAVILCGGKERRFGGRNKFLATVGGRSVIERVIGVLRQVTDNIIVVTSPEKSITLETDIRVVCDIFPAAGPLGGVYTGLVAAGTNYVIAVGCDMPFLNNKILEYMVAHASGYDVVVPRLGGRLVEPLHAVYAKTCIPEMKRRLERGMLAITPLFAELRVRYLEKEEYLPLDPQMLSFFNINYSEDLERANRIAAEIDIRGSPAEG